MARTVGGGPKASGAAAGSIDPAVLTLLRQQLVDVSRRGYDRGFVPGVSGNNSLRLPGTGLVLIKSTGCCQGDMTPQDTVLLTLEGEVLDAGRTPSKEWRWHLGIYRNRPDVGGVVHLHPPHAVAFAVADEIPPLVHSAARAHLRRLGRVDLLPAGSTELADAVEEQFSDTAIRGVMMREHGTITVGPDLWTAYYRTEYLEDDSRVALLARQLTGPSGPPLADDKAPLAEVNG